VVADDWPQWLGPKRDNTTAETVAPWSAPPKAGWRAKVGPGFSVPVVAGGKAFVHARVKGKDAEEVIAFDAVSGKELWRTAYPRAPYTSVLNTGPQATPAVAGGKVYTHGITGVLACFDAGSGKILWQADTQKKFRAPAPRFGVTCSPLVVGSRVLVAVGGRDGASVVGFDAATGEEKWRALDEPANTSSPVLFAPPGLPAGKLPDAVFMTTLRVVGLNPLDGSLTWEYPLPFQPGGTSPTPLVAGELVITTTTQNGATAIRPAGKAEADPAWRAAGVRGYFSTGVAAGPDLLFTITNVLEPTPRADLTCVDLKTGKELWKQEKLGYFHFGVVRTGDGKLLMLDDAGTLRLASADAGGYKELCQAKVCDGTMVAPAVAGGRVYVRDDDEVVCLEVGK
jgi:outer membrane protein assembly factor BamB